MSEVLLQKSKDKRGHSFRCIGQRPAALTCFDVSDSRVSDMTGL